MTPVDVLERSAASSTQATAECSALETTTAEHELTSASELETASPLSASGLELHPASGQHLMVTLRECKNRELLNDLDKLREIARAAAEATGATVLETCARQFSPQGVTVVVVLAESHASLHTYPEANVVFWDCFTCGTTCDPRLSIKPLERAFRPDEIATGVIRRR